MGPGRGGDRAQGVRPVERARSRDVRAARPHRPARHGMDRAPYRAHHRHAEQLLRRYPGMLPAPVPRADHVRQLPGAERGHGTLRAVRHLRHRDELLLARAGRRRLGGENGRHEAHRARPGGGPARAQGRRVAAHPPRHRPGVLPVRHPPLAENRPVPRRLRARLDERTVSGTRGHGRLAARERREARRQGRPLPVLGRGERFAEVLGCRRGAVGGWR